MQSYQAIIQVAEFKGFRRSERSGLLKNEEETVLPRVAAAEAAKFEDRKCPNGCRRQHRWNRYAVLSFAVATALVAGTRYSLQHGVSSSSNNNNNKMEAKITGKAAVGASVVADATGKKKKKKKTDTVVSIESETEQLPFNGHPFKRCEWVVNLFTQKYAGRSESDLKTQYHAQAADANVFYRATANIFWIDFELGKWHDRLRFDNLGINAVHGDGSPFQEKSTWTWVTGDQHLSNFGAWRNRNHDIVFSVNDFDEAAIYDFQVDILRIAVSIFNHAETNGLDDAEIKEALSAFTDTYVNTLVDYVGGDQQELYELTPNTASGKLQHFLSDLLDQKYGHVRDATEHQLEKFTEDGKFIHSERTRLEKVSPEVEEEIRSQFTIENYGATMMKMGWNVYNWGDFFEIMDVARRVGSGIGSYGVDRYYVLLKGDDRTAEKEDGPDKAIILDVKFAATPAVDLVLSDEDKAWYNVLFQNDAERAVLAQRKLTSYVDPFTGWIVLGGKAFGVRERSPWKASPDLTMFSDPAEFIAFAEQIAIVTATSHARGTVSKSPGQFKHVIASVLRHWTERMVWGRAVHEVAKDYRQQVLLDFECFKKYVDDNYS